MNDETELCTNYLERTRATWLEQNASLPREKRLYICDKSIEISSKVYRHDIYEEFTEDRNIIVFELARSHFLIEWHFCMGIELLSDQKTLMLNWEDLADLGIP